MMARWYRPKHVVTLNKINIHNTSCVLTCESLLLACTHIIRTYIHTYIHTHTHTHTHTHVSMLKCAPNVVFFSVWPLQSASKSSCPILTLEFSSVFAALCITHSYITVTCMCSFTSSQSTGCLQACIRCMSHIMSTSTALWFCTF
jgi:hypothetical protein